MYVKCVLQILYLNVCVCVCVCGCACCADNPNPTCQSGGSRGLRAMWSLLNCKYTGITNILACISWMVPSIMRSWCVTYTDTARILPFTATMSLSRNIFLFLRSPLWGVVSACHMTVNTGLPDNLSVRVFRRHAFSSATRRGELYNPPSPLSSTWTRMDLTPLFELYLNYSDSSN